MRRRDFIAVLAGAAVWSTLAEAQQAEHLPVVGILWAGDTESRADLRLAFLKGLAEFGYFPGKTFKLEERYANEVLERFDALANELVSLKVDVLVGGGGLPIYALYRATSTIPIVFVGVADPIAIHLVSNLSKPGGNITGITQMSADISTKRLQLLQQTIPTLSHVALLADPVNLATPFELSHFSSAAKELGLSLEVFDVRTKNDFDQLFQTMEERHFQAVIPFTANLLYSKRKQISALGLQRRLAIIGPFYSWVEAGSLLSYGADFPTLYHGAAYFVDKILKGEKVGNIPVQEPTKFDLGINLQTAKALGIEIPPAMLAIADRVIE